MGGVKGRGHSRRKTARRLIYLCVVLVLSLWAFRPSLELYKQEGEISRLEWEVAQIKEENEGLRREQPRPNSDEYLELLARRELGLVRPGQQPYLLLFPGGATRGGDLPAPPSRPAPAEEEPSDKGLVDSLVEKLGKLLN